MPDIQLHHGNCLDILPTLPDCSVDSIVTDPPYELGFMGKKWDNSGIAYNPDLWAECLRVLKPGGHLLAFGGTRTYHRMAVAIEDAGFEIRDSLHWIYGSGFPKSLDVSKAIDKQAGAEREVIGQRSTILERPITNSWGKSARRATQVGLPGQKEDGLVVDITAPATDAAKEWQGWGTALKPAHEPIVVARKPLVGTVAGNVLQYGTGAINIDGTRVAGDATGGSWGGKTSKRGYEGGWDSQNKPNLEMNPAGRWPANIVFTHNHDCTDICTEGCPVAELDRQSGIRKDGVAVNRNRDPENMTSWYGTRPSKVGSDVGYGGSGGASRFFTVTEWDAPFQYVAKPGKRERNAGLNHLPEKAAPKLDGGPFVSPTGNDSTKVKAQNFHPTVKPLALMRWLVRLVTPPGGTVLEPFAGSGTTLVACHLEGLNAIGIEMTDEYLPIIKGRLEWARQQPAEPDNPQQELEL